MKGDVVFHLHVDEDTIFRLRAARHILEKGSQYFMASKSDLTLHQNANNFKGFKPTWNQAAVSLAADSSPSDEPPDKVDGGTRPKKRIRLDDDVDTLNDDTPTDVPIEIHLDQEKDDIDYTTLHNIVYYLYTGCVNIDFPFSDEDVLRYAYPFGFPAPADPFLLYKNAKKFLVDGLTHHAFEVLRETLTPQNVVERLFRGPDDLRLCDELVDMYVDYLIENHDDVKDAGGWEAIEWDPECGDEVAKFRWSVVRRVMQGLQ
jgi:hypothetical protein